MEHSVHPCVSGNTRWRDYGGGHLTHGRQSSKNCEWLSKDMPVFPGAQQAYGYYLKSPSCSDLLHTVGQIPVLQGMLSCIYFSPGTRTAVVTPGSLSLVCEAVPQVLPSCSSRVDSPLVLLG